MGPVVALLVTVGFGATGLVGAAYLFRLAARGKRAGDVPHCAACEYDLTGLADLSAGNCPECGGVLDARSVARGERRRRPLLAVAGAALSLVMLPLVLIPVLERVRSYDWYRLRPLGRVIDDAASTSPLVARRAWAELLRRQIAGTTPSPAQRDRLAALALAQQQKRVAPGSDAVVEWIGDAALGGTLSPAQRDACFRQFVRAELRVRKSVVAGDPVPFTLVCNDCSPSSWWTRVDPIGLTCDGRPADEAILDATRSPIPDYFRLPTPPRASSILRIDRPGRHTLRLAARVNLFHGAQAAADPLTATPLFRYDVVLTAETEVLAAAPAGYVTMTRDAGMERLIRACIQPQGFWWVTLNKPGGELGGQLDVTFAPANIAFDVFARVDGKEHPLGSFALAMGGLAYVPLGADGLEFRSVEQFDLVLRTSEAAARRTVDLFEVWDGELVFPNTIVRRTPADQH